MMHVQQDQYVRQAIATDSLSTKELILRKKLIESLSHVPKLCDYPYLVDVEYLCLENVDGQLIIKAGQGDLVLTDGKNNYVAVEIKSSFVCYDGSDRIFLTKTSKLLEQVQYYTLYQRGRRPDATVHGAGVTEQKIYWWDANGHCEEYWWSSGPDTSIVSVTPAIEDLPKHGRLDMDILPEDIQELHARFLEETISRYYPSLLHIDPQGKLTYLSKCKQKRMTVCREHVSQSEINTIIQDYNQHGCYAGHILMFGMVRPTIIMIGST